MEGQVSPREKERAKRPVSLRLLILSKLVVLVLTTNVGRGGLVALVRREWDLGRMDSVFCIIEGEGEYNGILAD